MTVIKCTNCGGGPDLLSLLVSLAAVLIAAMALGITAREHREFMRQLRAVARLGFEFSVTNYEVDSDTGVLMHDAGVIHPVVRVLIRNTGNRTATRVLVNVTAPRHAELLRWSGPRGEELGRTDLVAAVGIDAPLMDDEGRELPAHHLVFEVPRITRSNGTVMLFVRFRLALPEGSPVAVPLEAVAQADELAEDVAEAEGRYVVRAQRRTPVPF